MALRIFDPDLLVQDLQPSEVSFPLFVFVKDRRPLTEEAQTMLTYLCGPPAQDKHPLVCVCAQDMTRLPYMVKLWLEDFPQADVWIPWNCCSPDLTLLPN